MKIGVIIQARTSSTRLPRKVLKPLPFNSDINVLQQVIRRVNQSKLINEIIIATTTQKEDDEIVDVAKKENVNWYRGSLENVLERYYLAALENNLDIIVRITSDCPCVDSDVIDKIIEKHLESNADYTSNTLNRGFPRGIDGEVINFDVLEKAYNQATDKFEKEHVTPFIYKTHPEDFNIVQYTTLEDNSDIRITLDTPQDYALLCSVYDNLYNKNKFFSLTDVIELFNNKPYLKDINSEITQKKVCNSLTEELDEVINLCEKQDLDRAKEYIKKII
ncbi:glycosyltransferase family protein [uncultured Methanobrevibacter sp.]|uniref:glycosyltransferase family protein n=1 Tax=uncultured Methanobrevibacter sp. TaxID=253161 RepID=UPI00260BC505|nr:glycosyltransferase family protein [uncultured Methanobrevibacter sp.]